MNPENETEFLKKINDIHTHLVGDPFSSPPKVGMITEHQANCEAIRNMNDKISRIEKWRETFRLRLALTIGVLVGAIEGVKQFVIGIFGAK